MVDTSFEKIKLEVQTVENLLKEKLSKLNASLNEIKTEISTLNVSRQTVNDKVASLRKTVQDSDAEYAKLKMEFEEKSRALETLETKHKGLTEENSENNSKKIQLEAEINKKETTQADLNKKIADKELDIIKVKDALLNAEQLYEDRVASIEREIAELSSKIENSTNQYKILRKLIQDGYIKDSHYDVCKVLRQPGVDAVEKLVLSSGVDKNTVIETLQELSSRNAISFDEGTGAFSVTKEFDI